jgi:hypothetical protein
MCVEVRKNLSLIAHKAQISFEIELHIWMES